MASDKHKAVVLNLGYMFLACLYFDHKCINVVLL